jgi:Winged helix-turn helix
MPRRAIALCLSDDELQRLAKLAVAPSTPQALAFRARLVLCCATEDRPSNTQVAYQLGCDPDTVCKWRRRFAHLRFDGLRDLPRSGRPPAFSP